MCVHLWGVRGKERAKCKNTINLSNLRKYVPRWHIYSQTTRNLLQIRTIYNLLCFCSAFACAPSPPPQHVAPHLPRSQTLPVSPQGTGSQQRPSFSSWLHLWFLLSVSPVWPPATLPFLSSFLLFCPSRSQCSISIFSCTSLWLCLR